jgi:hypothetical protein
MLVASAPVAVVLASAGTAGAAIDGPCSGEGTFESSGETHDAATTDKVVVPPSDSVAYVGRIETDSPQNRSHSGRIRLDLPPPLPDVEIVDWGTDDTDAVEDSGIYDYDLPWFVPRGVTVHVTGEHVDTAGTCTGEVDVEIEGGPFDAPVATIAALGLTIGSGALVVVAGRAR